jgi:hypothetical protein
MGDGELLKFTMLIEQLNAAPVTQRGDEQLRHLRHCRPVVER